jgi:hypothetical protein
VLVSSRTLGRDAAAHNDLVPFVENDALDLRATQVDSDALHDPLPPPIAVASDRHQRWGATSGRFGRTAGYPLSRLSAARRA